MLKKRNHGAAFSKDWLHSEINGSRGDGVKTKLVPATLVDFRRMCVVFTKSELIGPATRLSGYLRVFHWREREIRELPITRVQHCRFWLTKPVGNGRVQNRSVPTITRGQLRSASRLERYRDYGMPLNAKTLVGFRGRVQRGSPV
jgi:hypothetical protein